MLTVYAVGAVGLVYVGRFLWRLFFATPPEESEY